MGVIIEKFSISSNGFEDMIDITSKVQNIVSNVNQNNAVVNVSIVSSTASVITLEQEFGLANDFSSVMENIIPLNKVYKHDLSWHEGNAHAHLRAAMLGNNITLGVENKKIILGEDQKIVVLDFDVKSSTKQVVVSVIY